VNASHLTIENACLHDVKISDCMVEGMMIDGILVTDLLRAYQAQQNP
jgi:hypothetical protein